MRRTSPVLTRTFAALLGAISLLIMGTADAQADAPAKDFKQNCYSCHTIGGGRRTGPDLKDATKRKDRAWLVNFIVDPAGTLDSGDPYATQLLEAAGGQRMTNVAGMNRDRANGLLDLIEAESAKPKEELRFPGVTVSARPFTEADITRGRRLFEGLDSLKKGGPACIGCHTVGGIGGLGGGKLAPDLTKIWEKYQTREKFGSWLSGPATATMQPTFVDREMDMDQEILPLIAYLQHTAATQSEDTRPSVLLFVLLGLGLSVGVIFLFDRLWSRRFRGVRKTLVRDAALPNTKSNPLSHS